MKQNKALAAGTAFVVGAAITISATNSAFAGSPVATPLTPALVAQLSQGPRQPVIVLLRDQHPEAPPSKGNDAHRAAVTESDQRQLVAEAKRTGATHVTQFSVVNGFAATMTAAESTHLAADPQVAEVVPDLPVREPVVPAVPTGTEAGTAKPAPGACPADPKKPLLEPEALQTTHDTDAQRLATGKGVKVAYLADGIDTNNPDFIRADGSHVFTDYRDFTGEGTATANDDREAFGDASAIAAQGKQTYDLSTFVSKAEALPKGCDVRILGMAPGASLVGLKVIASNGFGSTSGVVQAIDYAVNVDHVDVINESLGANPYPDSGTDPFSLANNAAVAAGVTVVNSSGDAGYGNTVDSPASDPNIISVGASTTFRLMAQTWSALPGFRGTWENDNVSAISSSGVTQSGRVYDLIAPGDLDWALCSTDTAVHLGCTNYQNKPSPIQAFGGTSEAAPLTAGAAALVIQAYTQTHNGRKPTPALVKQILTSTATDNGDPAQRQGDGLLNALAAVQAAMSVSDANGAPFARGNGLLFGSSQLGATGAPGSTQHFALTVTNVGATAQTVTGRGRNLGQVLSDQEGSVKLDTGAPSNMVSRGGTPDNEVTKTFTVPEGADHLDASVAWPDPQGDPVTLVLLDPNGGFAGYSLPQASTGPDFGHVDVHSPMPGEWTALIYRPHSADGFDGQVNYQFTSTRYTDFGTVTGTLRLPPGHTGILQVTAKTPAQPGDAVAAVEVNTAAHQRFAVPLVLRSLVGQSGDFAGVLTGGNGRPGAAAQTNTFKVDVPKGKRDLDVNVTLQGSSNQAVLGYLVSPDGQILSQATNVMAVDDNGDPTEFGKTLQGYKRDPRPGRWTYVVVFQNPVAGASTAEPFTGSVRYDQADVSATGVPAAKHTLPAGKPVTATIHVHNTSNAQLSYYVDARTSVWSDQQLSPNASPADVPLNPSATLGYLVPPDTSKITGITSGSVPVSADLAPNTGAPERLAPPGPGNVAVATTSAPAVSQGLWLLEADPIGPFNAANTGVADFAAVAHTQSFDNAVTASSGDYWLTSIHPQTPAFKPVTVAPGQTGTITVTVKQTGKKGTVVTGWLYVDYTSLSNNAGD
ncbi:MAG TPA: S8 family serine peptidase [Pseudonocardiaceae bacterium]|nr:S8 family serine peptidase [Pseudonocardiaceae bacterium]